MKLFFEAVHDASLLIWFAIKKKPLFSPTQEFCAARNFSPSTPVKISKFQLALYFPYFLAIMTSPGNNIGTVMSEFPRLGIVTYTKQHTFETEIFFSSHFPPGFGTIRYYFDIILMQIFF